MILYIHYCSNNIYDCFLDNMTVAANVVWLHLVIDQVWEKQTVVQVTTMKMISGTQQKLLCSLMAWQRILLYLLAGSWFSKLLSLDVQQHTGTELNKSLLLVSHCTWTVISWVKVLRRLCSLNAASLDFFLCNSNNYYSYTRSQPYNKCMWAVMSWLHSRHLFCFFWWSFSLYLKRKRIGIIEIRTFTMQVRCSKFVQKAASIQSIQSCLWLHFENCRRQWRMGPVDYHFKRIYV